MLKVRIIPTLLWKGTGLVKGIGFDSWRYIGSVLPAIKVYNLRDVDELILVDITANGESREPDYESIKGFASECTVPFTVGGGITKINHITKLLSSGADKVVINTAAYMKQDFIKEAAIRFGSQCIVASIDYKVLQEGVYRCCSCSGTVVTQIDPVLWAQKLEKMGVGEILVTSIDRDGTMQGYDLPLIKRIVDAVDVPVIASGGAGNYEDMRRAIQDCGASAVAAASMFHFTQQSPAEAKSYLSDAGLPIRKNFKE
ncbi:cyclase [Methanocalculus alkaliphilus]|uniref:imidazole glycerol phosphate synthase subunit HisF n=1 Tax=Methanocalculus alkaliphilus TaxID=768730 RepID=UPI00209C895D|nr:imidazole glycerol phosphate synthase cyclase subunit [Methanocalculus alkaliphilus]MCP1716325.1 cyclase [Methanocalculus alkaliphilus]